MEISISLPKYLIKYMRTLYGEPYTPHADDEIGIYILNILERKTSLSEYKYSLKKNETHSYTLIISMSCYEKRGCLLSKEKLALIQKYIDSHFRKEIFRNAVLNYHKFKIPYKASILTALQAYDITEGELSYETLRKDFNRKKGAIEKRLIK